MQGQLDVNNFASEPFRERSRTILGVQNAPSGRPFPSPRVASKTLPIRAAALGAPGAKCTVPAPGGYSLPLGLQLPALRHTRRLRLKWHGLEGAALHLLSPARRNIKSRGCTQCRKWARSTSPKVPTRCPDDPETDPAIPNWSRKCLRKKLLLFLASPSISIISSYNIHVRSEGSIPRLHASESTCSDACVRPDACGQGREVARDARPLDKAHLGMLNRVINSKSGREIYPGC